MKNDFLKGMYATIVMLFVTMSALPQQARAQTKEAYVVRSADSTTLTFYYDAQKSGREGTTYGIDATQTDEKGNVLPAWVGTFKDPDKSTVTAVFDASFADYRPTSTRRWFAYCTTLESVKGMENLNTADVTDMSRMFYGCFALASLDLSHFSTANVTDMSEMFRACNALPALDLSSFNTANVTNMKGMFWSCFALASLNLSNFNTTNVTNMNRMFAYCRALASLDLSNFNTANVTNMEIMFWSCNALTSLNVSSFNTEKLTSLHQMFGECTALLSLDLSSFNTANVTDLNGTFRGCSSLTSLNISSFNTENVTDMWDMFRGCSSLTSLNLSHFNTAKVTNMGAMFRDCRALTSLDLSNFNMASIYSMYYMFENSTSLTTIYSNGTWTCGGAKGMFKNCEKLVGAVTYDKNKIDVDMANPETGYFTKKSPAGISSATASPVADAKDIYTLQGVRLAGKFENLPAGVYIVDGRKVVKK